MQSTEPRIAGDQALHSADGDRLGFREVAARIATALVDHASENGLVVGLEGAWGSGKSSLLFLIEEELGQLPQPQQPSWINFRPWLIGNRDALLANLFTELAKGISDVELAGGDSTRDTVDRAKKAAESLRKFADALGKAGGIIEFAGDATGFVPMKWLGRGLKAVKGASQKEAKEPPLAKLKADLVDSLHQLKHRFVIAIDDVDRLEPSELVEVLRLVRSVTDLPNVIYLLCYDAEILAHSVQQAAKVKNGRSYLEKMVQLTVMVPKPEPFQLRNWFTSELAFFASTPEVEAQSRLGLVVDLEGGRQLTTPRSVVRALDALRFFWPPLRESGADLADAVWVQLIKNGNPRLYRWIEDYSATAGAMSLGIARVEDSQRAADMRELSAVVGDYYFDDVVHRQFFADQFLGLEVVHEGSKPPFKPYQLANSVERDRAILNKRLASPDHYKLYFALGGPSHALSQADFDSIWSAATIGAAETSQALLQFYSQNDSGSLSKADVFLERLRIIDASLITEPQARNLLLSFSASMDAAYASRPFDLFWVNSIWDRAERAVPVLLGRLSNRRRLSTLKKMFAEGVAIGWLTSIFRRETFAQGRFGEKERAESEWLISAGEMDQVTEVMLRRYSRMRVKDFLKSPNPISILFAWLQGGDEEGPWAFVEKATLKEEGLLETMEVLQSFVRSTGGNYLALRESELKHFMNVGTIQNRITRLTKSTDSAVASRALKLLAAFGADQD